MRKPVSRGGLLVALILTALLAGGISAAMTAAVVKRGPQGEPGASVHLRRSAAVRTATPEPSTSAADPAAVDAVIDPDLVWGVLEGDKSRLRHDVLASMCSVLYDASVYHNDNTSTFARLYHACQ